MTPRETRQFEYGAVERAIALLRGFRFAFAHLSRVRSLYRWAHRLCRPPGEGFLCDGGRPHALPHDLHETHRFLGEAHCVHFQPLAE